MLDKSPSNNCYSIKFTPDPAVVHKNCSIKNNVHQAITWTDKEATTAIQSNAARVDVKVSLLRGRKHLRYKQQGDTKMHWFPPQCTARPCSGRFVVVFVCPLLLAEPQ